ncbi:MAG: phosphate-starvation-inducible PsiE family protein [Cyanobium sp.]|nr:phosphate-starvation-inducible PsiE family protein [Cyanobium sp.]
MGSGHLRSTFSRLFNDAGFLRLIDRIERQLAKLIGFVLVVVMLAAALQMIGETAVDLTDPQTPWLGERLNKVLGDLLTLLIAIEVLQNITSYLRRHVVQIELVLVTAMTAVARKVIVLPAGAESKPQLLAGLGVAVLALAAAYWLVRSVTLRTPPARTAPAKPIRAQDPSPPADADALGGSAGNHHD